MLFISRYACAPTLLLKYPAIWDKTIHRIGSITIHRSAIHCQTRPLHRKTSVTKFSFRTFWPAQNTTSGCITPIHPITICSPGPYQLQPVNNYSCFRLYSYIYFNIWFGILVCQITTECQLDTMCLRCDFKLWYIYSMGYEVLYFKNGLFNKFIAVNKWFEVRIELSE